MYNYIMLIGRLCNDVEISESNNGKAYSRCTLAVQRPFKNPDNVYDTDFIPVTIFDSLCETAQTYLHKGDLVALKGRVSTNEVELSTGAKVNALSVIAERIMFISQKNKEE